MKRFYITLVFLFILAALLYSSIRLYFYLTDGFSLSNIKSTSSYDPAWEVPPLSDEEKELVFDALNQKYYYLGKGCQTYAFVSEDGNYVIKFFKHKHLRIDWWWKYIPLPQSYQEFRNQKIKLKKAKLQALFGSAKLGYEKLPEETGLIYIHLNKGKTPLAHLTIFDKLGFKHHLNLEKLEFLLQIRALPVYPTITHLVEKKDIRSIKRVFQHLIDVLISRSQKGVADLDPAMIQNLGLLDDRALIIDIGQLMADEKIKDPKNYSKDIQMRSKPFIKWLQNNHPELVPIFEETLHNSLKGDF